MNLDNLKFDVQVRRKDLWLKCHQYEPDESYRKRWEEAQGKSYYRAVLRHERSVKALETAEFRSEEDETPHLRNLRDMIDHVIRRRVYIKTYGPPEPCDQCGGGGYRQTDTAEWHVCDRPACQAHVAALTGPDLPKVELTVEGWPGEWEPLSIQIPVDPDAPPP
jgi:hypothetical protein